MEKKNEPKIWIVATVLALMVTLVFAVLAIGVVSATTWYVEEDESIQAAVNAADPCDTIIVRDGTYTENVDVNKSLTIRSENGAETTIVQAANPENHVLEVSADHVNISRFTAKGGGGYPRYSAGIYLHNVNHCNISNNNALNNDWGIYLSGSSSNIISNNNVNSNNEGIYLGYLTNNNIISNNNASNNWWWGIILGGANSNNISNNNVSNNEKDGIGLFSSSNNTLLNNDVSNNQYDGISLYDLSNNNSVTNNEVSNNDWGIYLENHSSDNIIYLNNFVNNRENVKSYNSSNTWNTTPKLTYIYNGSQYTNYLGNYWDDYTGPDDNKDGIGDTPYSINSDNDNYPLMERFENYITNETVNHPPYPPASLVQFKSDSETEIPVGGATDERTVILKGNVSDPDGDKVKLQIELRGLDEYDGTFLQRFTQQSDLENGSNQVSVPVYGLVDGDYHWQARTVDEQGLASEWVSFGNNDDLAADFLVKVNYLPIATFTYSPKYPEVGEEIVFNASQSKDPDGGTISYEWNFGDEEVGSGEKVNHTYSTIGNYLVTLTVVDGEGTESKYFINVGVFSEELRESIEYIVNRANNSLDDILSNAKEVGEAADYFNQEVSEGEKETVVDFVFNVIGLIPSPKIDDIPLLNTEEYAKLAEDYPQYADILDVLIQGEMEKVEEEITKDVYFGILEIISKWFANLLPGNDYSFYEALVPDLQRKVDDAKGNITNFEQDVLNNLPSLTPEEIDLYQKDLQKRVAGNILTSNFYATKSLLPTTFQDIKTDDEKDWKLKLGKTVWKGSIRLLTIATGGVPGAVIFGGGDAVREQLENWRSLSMDAQMLSIGTQTLVDASTQADHISRNTIQGLRNIKEGSSPNIAEGEIVSSENIIEGHFQLFGYSPNIFAKNVYSEVEIKNTGDTKANYKLTATYTKPYTTFELFPGVGRTYLIPVVDIEEEEIEPSQSEIITVWYKKEGEGIKPPKNSPVYFNLLGETNNGIYGLDSAVTTFGTTIIITNDVNVSEEELEKAQIYSYPIKSEIENSFDNNSTLNIYISNPFDFPVPANLTQTIPPKLDIISAENGTINKNNISWELELEPKERKAVNITFRSKENPETTIEILGAALKVYDQVKACWVEFPSNNVTISEKLIFDTDSPPNPYPSIMGNHTGTIKPNHTVVATKIYTYPCEGTGGHTEYAKIGNATWNATATWDGYVCDWHNITFDKTVVLLANKTYNYIICTGSYPQIQHTPALPTANGWINCTQFVDANGKKYYDWIPAIRLE